MRPIRARADDEDDHRPLESPYAIDLSCEPIAGEEYTASLTGKLYVTGYRSFSFDATGSIEASLFVHGNTAGPQAADALGRFNFNGGAEIEFDKNDALALLFLSNDKPDGSSASHSRILGVDGNDYWTDCSPSAIELPEIPDLVPKSTIRTWRIPGSVSQQMRLDVTNVGNAPVKSGRVRISLDGTQVLARLTAGVGLQPGRSGEIYFEADRSMFQRCREYAIQIDLDHQLQNAPFDTYSNDTGTAKTSCLAWSTVIDEVSFGAMPHAAIAGKTVDDILNSRVSGRADGKVCTDCHAGADLPGKFRVPMGAVISPGRVIGGSTWASYPGLVEWFINARPYGNPKPEHLVTLLTMWRSDGARYAW